MKDTMHDAFIETLQELCDKNGVSFSALAKKSNLHPTSLNPFRIIKNKRWIRLDTLLLLLYQGFNMEPSTFFKIFEKKLKK